MLQYALILIPTIELFIFSGRRRYTGPIELTIWSILRDCEVNPRPAGRRAISIGDPVVIREL